MENSIYKNCRLCMRECGVDRTVTHGFCGVGDVPSVSRSALHFWEEPCISGTRGSGTIFFDGCSFGCVFCQNRQISRGSHGAKISTHRLAEMMLELEKQGAHNINFVTPTHYSPSVREAILLARSIGLSVPIVYNTGSYDSLDTIRSMDGTVDIYLPDFKFYISRTASKFANAPLYPDNARCVISEMYRQTGAPRFDSDGIMTRGVIVRILLLPGHVAEAKLTVKYLYDTYGDSVYISLMNQYTPMPDMSAPLDRRVTHSEYEELVQYALNVGVTNAFTQEYGTAEESFIPPFDGTGV